MPSSPTPVVLTAIGAVVFGLSLAACGGSATAKPSGPVPAAEVHYAAEPGDPASADSIRTLAKVSANTASEEAIAAALKAAGVSSPKRWAAEVIEYRPYAASDLGLKKLREELLKYHPAQQTLDRILSVLLP